MYSVDDRLNVVLARNIKMYRKMYEYTLEELAGKLNTSKGDIHNWENEKSIRHPSITSLIILCDIFHCTPNDLLGYSK